MVLWQRRRLSSFRAPFEAAVEGRKNSFSRTSSKSVAIQASHSLRAIMKLIMFGISAPSVLVGSNGNGGHRAVVWSTTAAPTTRRGLHFHSRLGLIINWWKDHLQKSQSSKSDICDKRVKIFSPTKPLQSTLALPILLPRPRWAVWSTPMT